MNKSDVKRILMSMRNTQNEAQINNLLGKVDLLDENKLQEMLAQIGDNEQCIRSFINQKLKEEQSNRQTEHEPINDMFAYGIARNCIHLHMPVDLHSMMKERGLRKTFATVNLYLLDAIEKIRDLQNNGFHKFKGKKEIYMISPVLVGAQLKLLEGLDFEIHSYSKNELQSKEFVGKNPEAFFATHIFGTDKNVGTAKISMEKINLEEWQKKRRDKVAELEKMGGTLSRTTEKNDAR